MKNGMESRADLLEMVLAQLAIREPQLEKDRRICQHLRELAGELSSEALAQEVPELLTGESWLPPPVSNTSTNEGRQMPRAAGPKAPLMRRPEYVGMSTLEAVRRVLNKSGELHADAMVQEIFMTTNHEEAHRAKGGLVSEIVKAIAKHGDFKRTAPNVYALNKKEELDLKS
jgi:hypothetical protein